MSVGVAIERQTYECLSVVVLVQSPPFTSDRALSSLYIHASEGNRSLDNGTIIGEGNMSDSNQKLWTLISCTIAHLHLTAFRAGVNTPGPGRSYSSSSRSGDLLAAASNSARR